MRIVFMGTAEFAVPSLLKLAQNTICVITAVDKPQGRGYYVQETPVKKAANKLGLEVLAVEKLKEKEIVEKVKKLKPDLIAVVDFGMIVPDAILNIPSNGTICLHPSLLPKYRGPSPIEYALLNGDTVTGNTIFYVVKEVDSGNIIIQKEHKITKDDTNGSLRKTLAAEGADLFYEAVQLIEEGKAPSIPQNHAEAILTKKLEKENINWGERAQAIFNKVRAFTPKPGIFTLYKNKKLKITKSKLVEINVGAEFSDDGSRGASARAVCPGEIIKIIKDKGFIVSCADAGLLILEVHPENKNIMDAWNFVNGYRVTIGDKLC